MSDDLVMTNTQPTICLEIPTLFISQKELTAPTKLTFIYSSANGGWSRH
jgi:hypothetical protein